MKTAVANFLEFFLVLGVMFVGCAFLARLALARFPVAGFLDRMEEKAGGVSYLLAALFGAVTPFCVCTTIPIFTAMLQAGAKAGVAVAFLLSSPLVSISGAALILFMFGVKFTAVYVLCAVGFSVVGGVLVSWLGLDGDVDPGLCSMEEAAGGGGPTARDAFRSAWQLFRNLFFPLLLGAVIAGVIHNVVPVAWIAAVNHYPPLVLIPLMALIGFPIYSNILVLAPIALVLGQKGLAPGAVMTFLMAGAGMSFPTAIVLRKILRARLYYFYLGYTFVVYCVSGLIFGRLS